MRIARERGWTSRGLRPNGITEMRLAARLSPRHAFELLLLAGLVLHALHTGLGVGGPRLDGFVNQWLYVGLLVACAGGCLARALASAQERGAWIALGVALTSSAGGDAYYSLVLGGSESASYPSPADALWLAFYPLTYVAVILLLEARAENLNASVRLDGAIAGAAVTALGAALLFPRLVDSSGGGAAAATNLAYPLGDLLLLAAVVGVYGLAGRSSGAVFALLGAGLTAMALVDLVYLDRVAAGTWADGTLWDSLWPVSAFLMARASWTRSGQASRVDLRGRSLVVVPALGGVIAIAVLVWDHFDRLHLAAIVAAAVALGAVLVRLALTFRENARVFGDVNEQALTDALTGLGNRRRLLHDLPRRLASGEPALLVIHDLDGFKAYNDTYGHPAGDSLLQRLGAQLAAAAEPYGTAYRLGGDEFCTLLEVDGVQAETALHAVSSALVEEGESFTVAASFGAAVIPDEADSPSAALKLADHRLYAQKRSAKTSAGRQTHDALLRALFERAPELHGHMHNVAELSRALGEHLRLPPDDVEQVVHAAELHDIGKLAIPDAILRKTGPLTAEELSYVRKHTVVGERILSAAPALTRVAQLVRASHERWDGAGYPDGLAGAEIALGARIIAVCDAFDAIVSERPNQPARTPEAACAELRRCSGSQFDPAVVAAFEAVWSERRPVRSAASAAS
jgi:diguanylate cyclase (GGDEF)-like protein